MRYNIYSPCCFFPTDSQGPASRWLAQPFAEGDGFPFFPLSADLIPITARKYLHWSAPFMLQDGYFLLPRHTRNKGRNFRYATLAATKRPFFHEHTVCVACCVFVRAPRRSQKKGKKKRIQIKAHCSLWNPRSEVMTSSSAATTYHHQQTYLRRK